MRTSTNQEDAAEVIRITDEAFPMIEIAIEIENITILKIITKEINQFQRIKPTKHHITEVVLGVVPENEKLTITTAIVSLQRDIREIKEIIQTRLREILIKNIRQKGIQDDIDRDQ